MAEIVATLAAVLQLSGYGLHAAREVFKFARDAGAARQEIESFANRIQFFSISTRHAGDTLNDYCRDHPRSKSVLYIEHHLIGDVEHNSDLLRRRITNMKSTLRAMESSSTIMTYLRWRFNKSSVMGLIPEMDCLQGNLMLLMASVKLEALGALQKQSDISAVERVHLEQESASLRQEIRGLVETIKNLQVQLNTPGQSNGEWQSGEKPDTFTTQVPRSALLKLGRSMHKHGVAPEVPVPTPTTSEQDPPRHRRVRRHPRGRENDGSGATTGPSSPGISLNHTSFRDGTSSTSEISSVPSPPSPETSLSDSPKDEAPSSPISRADPFSRPAPDPLPIKALYLDPDRFPSTGGFVTSRDGHPILVTAVVHESLDSNLISMTEAVRFGLVQGTGGVKVDFGEGRIAKSIGRVKIEWNNGNWPDKRYLPLMVECEVLKACQPGIVLGRRFIEERAHLWPGRFAIGSGGGAGVTREGRSDGC